MIIFAAHLLSDKKRNLNDWQMGLLPILTLLSPVFVLVLFQPDVGTLSIMLVVLFAMMFFAKVPKKYLFTIGMFCLIALVIMVFVKPYRMQRIQVFMHPEIDPLGKGYHMNQAFLAIGSGGLWGLGVGQSRQKYQYLPEVHADSIFAIISEETGFFISTIFICLILLLGLRGLKISKYATDGFARLASVGVVVWIVWQSFLNIGAMVGVLPITGVPLPFVSHGGSALAAELAAAGLVLNISRK
jgi:cell division protein FtsW